MSHLVAHEIQKSGPAKVAMCMNHALLQMKDDEERAGIANSELYKQVLMNVIGRDGVLPTDVTSKDSLASVKDETLVFEFTSLWKMYWIFSPERANAKSRAAVAPIHPTVIATTADVIL
jgi:hypothetical protein